MRKKIEEEVTARLTAQLNSEWTQREATLKNELVVQKSTLQKVKKKMQSKVQRMWNFFKTQCAGSSTMPLESSPNEDLGDGGADDNDNDKYRTSNLGDDSRS